MKQITVLARNEDNLIAYITRLLADAGIDIDSITGENYGDQSVVTITTPNYNDALKEIQKQSNLQVICEDALLVQVSDELGALAKLSRRFADAGITIRSIRFVERHNGYALVAIGTERSEDALKLVEDILVS